MAVEELWPNTSGFDTKYEELEPVGLNVSGSIPYYAAGVLCEYRSKPLSSSKKCVLRPRHRSHRTSRLQNQNRLW